MIEFTSNHKGIGLIEKACADQVRKGTAVCLKRSREGESEMLKQMHGQYEGSEYHAIELEDKQDLKGRGFDVSVYSSYILRINRGGFIFTPHEANIRFWYDKRTRIAGVKISEESLIAIIQTTAVANLLHNLDVSLGGGKDGKMTLDKVATLLTKTLVKVAPGFRGQFTAQKK